MMLARVSDSLYWLGRSAERAEHVARLAAVMLNATLDRTDAADQAARIALAAVGGRSQGGSGDALDAARLLVLDRDGAASVVTSLAGARENARQIREQITTESWERLNLLYLRATGTAAEDAFASDAPEFLQRIIADLHQFKGAAEATMSHGEGWRFMLTGVYIERAQLIARLLNVCFGGEAGVDDHVALVSLLRMACALEPYLRVYTADINARYILEFLMFDKEFPRSIRFSTERIMEYLTQLSGGGEPGRNDPLRLAGRLNARLTYADIDEVESGGAGELLASVSAECDAIHAAIHDTFVAYPLEMKLPT
ncbi:MAG TPA: alpha-E domain-containing protein [Caulobacteraceae bacterium]